MVALGTDTRQQLGRLGIAPEALGAQLARVSPDQLRKLSKSAQVSTGGAAGLARTNRFSADLRDGRSAIPKPFANPSPALARAERARYVAGTYAVEAKPTHPSAAEPLRMLLHPRRGGAAKLGLAVQRRPELRERAGVALGALIVDDGRTDGVISVARGQTAAGRASASRGSSAAPGPSPSLPPPAPAYGTGSIWEIMMAMDQAILHEAAKLGLGQGSGLSGTTGVLEAMGLWSLTPDEDSDPTRWAGLGRSTGRTASGMTGTSPVGTVGPENENSGLDVDIMRLKRQIDKKTQMMELYSQTMSKYNSSANAIIGNLKG